MRIEGKWLLCDDGVERPVISGEILGQNGSWESTEFLVDTGADRTVFSAATRTKLGLASLASQDGVGGLGGIAESVVVETQIRLVAAKICIDELERAELRIFQLAPVGGEG
jgi:hypothetical protein